MSRASRTDSPLDRLMLAAFLAVCAMYCLTPVHNGNFFWHVRNGEDILSTGSVRTTDPFTWTAAGDEWLQQEWLAEVSFAAAWSLPGESGPVLLKMLVVIASILLVSLAARRLGAGIPAIVTVGILWLVLAHGRWIVRPHIFSILFFSIYVYLLARGTGGPLRSLAIFLPLQILWTNFHAGFVMGWFLLSIPVASMLLHRDMKGALSRSGVLLAAVACSGIHPNGFRSVAYLTDFLSRPLFRQTIREWWSPFHPFYQPGSTVSRTAVILTCLLAGTLLLIILKRKRLDPVRTAALGLLAAATVFSSRNIDLLALAAIAWTAPLLGRVGRRVPAALLAAVTVLPFVVGGIPREFGPPRELGTGIDWDVYPGELTAFLRENPELLEARLFNTNEISGYIEYEFATELPLYMDGRCHLYGEGLYAEYLLLASSPDRTAASTQLSILDGKGIDLALMTWPEREGSVQWAMAASPRWLPLYWDDLAMVYARRSYLQEEDLMDLAFRYVDPLMPWRILEEPFHELPFSRTVELVRAAGEPMGLRQTLVPASALLARRGLAWQAIDILESGFQGDPLADSLVAILSGEMRGSDDGRLGVLGAWILFRSGDHEGAAELTSRMEDTGHQAAMRFLIDGPSEVPPSSPAPPMVPAGAWQRVITGTALQGEERSARLGALLMCGMEDKALDSVFLFLADSVQLPPWGYSVSGGILALAGEDSIAALAGDSAIALNRNPYTLSMRGRIAEMSGDLAAAAGYYTDALELGPMLHDTRLRRAASLWELGMLEEALDDYHALREVNYLPARVDPWCEWAEYLTDAGAER